MHDDRELAEARLRRTIRDRIRPALHGSGVGFDVEAWIVPGEPVPVAEARARLAAGDFAPFEVGARWGRPWGTVWFRLRGSVPPDWADRTVEARIDFSTGVGAGFQSEGMLYRTDSGGPLRGIHPFHQAVPVGLIADADGAIDVLVEAAANPIIGTSHEPTPLGDPATAGEALLYRLNRAEMAVRNDDVWHLDLDLQIAVGVMRELGLEDPRRFEVLRVLDAAMDALDPRDVVNTAGRARDALAPWLARTRPDPVHRTSAVGHAHIDSAWLWPLRETRRKCARTFSSAVTLMESYPEYRFVCSQAAQYQWIEDDQPELFDRIRTKVDDGRFVPVGGMWVEADANLPSGESLARQFVWGIRYFEDRFGLGPGEAGNRICWIPDVFGYAGNLPQIMAAAGCDYFLTQKLSWNQTNDFPHHTFRWEGIDGTRVLTHFPPVDTYNGEVVPRELAFSVRNFRDKGRSDRSMYLFGHGDGGGGPTREMLERARRVADLDGLPSVTIESPEVFFDAVAQEYPDAPVWRGELYFEMHRGTFTSQARTKWGNRRGELALRELEVWTAPGTGAPAPLRELERLWKVLLLHQFHDIIPGSSIAWVHDDTEAAHAELLAECEARTVDALTSRAAGAVASVPIAAANAGPFAHAGPLEGPDGLVWVDVGPHAVATVSAGAPLDVDPVTVSATSTDRGGTVVIGNGVITATIAADGTIASLVAHEHGDRECLAAPGNVLQLFADVPNTYDAWDIEQHTLRLEPAVLTEVSAIDVVESGPLRAQVRVTRAFGSSTISQTYVLRAGSERLDIETDADWHEDETLLKAAFPWAVRADDACFDVQYGHVRRPTHRNTSWDAARFEVCGHFWADVAEPDFGMALLNNGKYGHDVLGDSDRTTMRLSLLRAPNYPDPDADRGRHRFTYAVMPHGPSLASVLPQAWALNLPPRLVRTPAAGSVVAADHPGVVITAVKAADDGSGDLVVRAHEALGGRARTVLTFASAWREAVPCDLLESVIGDPFPLTEESDTDTGAASLTWELGPFEVVTLRLRP